MDYVIVDQCFSQAGVAGLRFTHCKGFAMNHVLFILLSSSNQESELGIAITSNCCSGNCTIAQSAFVKMRNLAGFTVFAAGRNEAMQLRISACCFTGTMRDEIKGAEPVQVVIDNETSLFGEACETHVAFLLARPMGYMTRVKEADVAWADKVLNGMIVTVLSQSAKFVMPAGAVCGVVLWGLLRMIPKKKQRRRRPRRIDANLL